VPDQAVAVVYTYLRAPDEQAPVVAIVIDIVVVSSRLFFVAAAVDLVRK
jgi:hypothetical protein